MNYVLIYHDSFFFLLVAIELKEGCMAGYVQTSW